MRQTIQMKKTNNNKIFNQNNFILFWKSDLNVKDVTINTYLRAVMYYFMKLGYLDEFKITNIKFDKHIIDTYTD